MLRNILPLKTLLRSHSLIKVYRCPVYLNLFWKSPAYLSRFALIFHFSLLGQWALKIICFSLQDSHSQHILLTPPSTVYLPVIVWGWMVVLGSHYLNGWIQLWSTPACLIFPQCYPPNNMKSHAMACPTYPGMTVAQSCRKRPLRNIHKRTTITVWYILSLLTLKGDSADIETF